MSSQIPPDSEFADDGRLDQVRSNFRALAEAIRF